jgi:hypothetical protein
MKHALVALVSLLPVAAAAQIAVPVPVGVRFPSGLSESHPAANADVEETPLPGGMSGPVRVFWSGREFLVVGSGPGGLTAIRLDAHGRVLDETPLRQPPFPNSSRSPSTPTGAPSG